MPRKMMKFIPLFVSLLIGLCAPSARAAQGPNLLAESHWEYSVDGGRTFSTQEPVVAAETKADILVAVQFNVPQLPSDTAALELTQNLRAVEGGGFEVQMALNGHALQGPLSGMQYRDLMGINPDYLQQGDNLLTFRVSMSNLSASWKKAEDVPLKMAAQLRPMSSDAFRIQTGPILGAMGPDYFTVTCRTNMPAAVSLEVTNDAGEKVCPPVVSNGGYIHRLRVSGLSSDTRYSYVLTASLPDTGVAVKSRLHAVRTLPDASAGPGPFRFVVTGDSRSRPECWEKVASAISRADARFLLFSGDMVSFGPDDFLWDSEFFGRAGALFTEMPIYPLLGNHEHECPLSTEIFYTPSPDGRGKDWVQSVGNVLLIAIDGGEDWSAGSSNARWLEQTLAGANEKFVFVLTHYPAWTSSLHGRLNEAGQPAETPVFQAQSVILPLMVKYHATALLAGHDHVYERSDPPGGVTEIITGGAGAPLGKKADNAIKQNPYSVIYAPALHYCLFEVNGDTCVMRALTPEGEQLDTVTWKARAAGPTTTTVPAEQAAVGEISRKTSVDLLAVCR